MSYYNYVFVLFNRGIGSDVEFRTGCQALPGGAIPIAIINANTKTYTEVINDISPQAAFSKLSEIINREYTEEAADELHEEIKGEYELILSVYPGWDFEKGDTLEVEI